MISVLCLIFIENECNDWLTKPVGEFRSPSKAVNGIICTWIIESPKKAGKNISIEMEILANRNEKCDPEDNVIKVYSQESNEAKWNLVYEVKNYCENQTLRPISKWTRRALVILYTSKKTKFKGFKATYQISDKKGNNRFHFGSLLDSNRT